MPAPLYIGLDAGGTKTEVLARAGAVQHRLVGEGVNLQRDGAEASAARLAALIAEALAQPLDAEVGGICAGVAGAARPSEQADLAARIRRQLGDSLPAACPLVIEHDAAIALEAAFPGESGMIVIVGTGSVVLARTEDGQLLRAGGWGPRIGDPGSGVALGTAALAAVAADLDGGEPTVLRHRLQVEYGITEPDDLIRLVYQERLAPQHLAPLVVAAAAVHHDWVATRILKAETNTLAQRAGWLATRANGSLAERVALLGGLAEEPYYRECLAESLLRHLPRWRLVRAARRPAEGALALAERMAQASV